MNMNNLDDIIQGFVCCTQLPPNCRECPQKGPGDDFGHKCRTDVKVDVMHALMAYRDCIRNKIAPPNYVHKEIEGGGSTWWYVCEECHTAVDSGDQYCRHCGRQFVS